MVHAVCRKGRVRRSHVDGLDAGRTEHIGRVRGQTNRAAAGIPGLHLLVGAVLAQTRTFGDVDSLVGPDLHVECRIGCIDRGLRRLEQAHRAIARAAEVAHRPRRAVIVQRRRAGTRIRVGQSNTVLQTRDESEGLECRSGLHMTLRRGVEGLIEVVLAAVEGFDSAVVGVDRDESGLHAFGLILREGLNRLLGRLHPILVEGGDDVVATAVELGFVDIELAQGFTTDEVPHVALLTRQGGLLVLLPHLGHLDLRGLLLGDETFVDHVLDHVVEAVFVHLRVVRGVGGTWALDHRGQQSGLADVEFRGRLVEVVLSCHFDAVGATAEVDGVEVVREDLVLRLLLVDLERDEHLLDLAIKRMLVREVEVLHVLLGDRRTATRVLVRGHADDGAGETLDRDAAVLVERGVLGGDRGLLHGFGDLFDLNGLAIFDLVLADRRLAVAVVDRRGLTGGLEVRLGDVRCGISDGEGHAQGDDEAEPADDEYADARQEASPSAHTRSGVVEQILRIPADVLGCVLSLSHPRSSRSVSLPQCVATRSEKGQRRQSVSHAFISRG